jgi:hypothetical protein
VLTVAFDLPKDSGGWSIVSLHRVTGRPPSALKSHPVPAYSFVAEADVLMLELAAADDGVYEAQLMRSDGRVVHRAFVIDAGKAHSIDAYTVPQVLFALGDQWLSG